MVDAQTPTVLALLEDYVNGKIHNMRFLTSPFPTNTATSVSEKLIFFIFLSVDPDQEAHFYA